MDNQIEPEKVEETVETLRVKGNQAFKDGNYNEAKSIYTRALDLNESDAKILSNLSACCLSLKEFSKAIEYATLCIKHDPTWSKGYFRKAKAHQSLQETELAYVNAAKCTFYEPSFKSQLDAEFNLKNGSTSTKYFIVNNDIEMNMAISNQSSTITCILINNCDVSILYPVFNMCVVLIGIGKARITSKAAGGGLALIKSECLISNISFLHDNSHAIFAQQSTELFINECFFTSSADERLRRKALAAICVVGKTKLRMQKTELNGCNEAGLLAEDASINVTNCVFKNSRMDTGSAVEVRKGADGMLDSCSIESYAKGILSWTRQSSLKVLNCSIFNCRSEGILVSFEPPGQFLQSLPKPVKHITSIIGCKVVGNAAFGITIDDNSNAIISKSEIAFNGSSGCIIKGGVTCTIIDNFIHSNKLDGIQIGYNLAGTILVRNNRFKSNGAEAINNFYEKMGPQEVNLNFKIGQAASNVYKKPSVENNILEKDSEEGKIFKTTRYSANRPSTRILDDFNPFMYSCGNTFAFNVLNHLDISPDTAMVDVFLGGACDLRHFTETCFQLEASYKQQNTQEKHKFLLNFKLNDINFTNLAHCVVVLYAMQQWDDSPTSIADLIMLWTSPCLYKSQKKRVDKLLGELNVAFQTSESAKKELPWLNVNENTLQKLQTSIRLWKKYTYCLENLVFHGKQERVELFHWKGILTSCLGIEEEEADLIGDQLRHGHLKYSSSIMKANPSTESKANQVNNTLFIIPTLDYNVYETSCIFRCFKLYHVENENDTTVKHKSDVYDKYFDKLVVHLNERLIVIRSLLRRSNQSALELQISLDNNDILDAMLIDPETSNQLFDSIDCSNVGEYVDNLSLLLSASLRLKASSTISMHFMKGQSSKASLSVGLTQKKARKRIEECVGLTLDELDEFFQLKLIDLQIEANGSYFNTIWQKSSEVIVNWTPRKQTGEFVDKMITMVNTVKNFSAGSLAFAFTYVLNSNNWSSAHQWLLEAVNNMISIVKSPFIEEFTVLFTLNSTSVLKKAKTKITPLVAVCNEFKLNVKKDEKIILITKLLKLNELAVRLRLFDPRDKTGVYYVWHSFELDEQSETSLKVRFITREAFCLNNEKWELVLEGADIAKSNDWKVLTDPVKLRGAKQTAQQAQLKRWWFGSSNTQKADK